MILSYIIITTTFVMLSMEAAGLDSNNNVAPQQHTSNAWSSRSKVLVKVKKRPPPMPIASIVARDEIPPYADNNVDLFYHPFDLPYLTDKYFHHYTHHDHLGCVVISPPLHLQQDDEGGPTLSNGSISLSSDKFEVTACHDRSHCSGYIKIQRLGHCPLRVPVSQVPETNAYLKSMFGPDSFQILFEGKEVFASRALHLGNCLYKASYQFTMEGISKVKVQLLFRNYLAVTERFDGSLWLRRIPFYRDRIIAHFDYIRCMHPDYKYWFRMNPMSQCADGTARGRWLTDPVYNYTWSPYNCFYPALNWTTPNEHVQCLRGIQISFVGDSQVRSVFYGMLNKLSETEQWDNEKINVTLTQKLHGVTINFHPDPYLRYQHQWYELLNQTNQTTAFIAGVGNWPAAGKIEFGCKWPDYIYRKYILDKARELRKFQSRSSGTVVLWLGIPCFPHPSIDSRRSKDRIMHMDQFALDVMRSSGIRVIDWFQLSESMIHTSFDRAHYINHVRSAVTSIVVNEICRGLGRLRV